MDIAPYIADLLRQHDEVNVPSLGTFYKQRKPGYYDPERKEFLPPSFGLSFKEAADSSSLISYISEQKNISVNTANYFTEKFVSQTKSQLSVYGYADIDALGKLKKSKDGYIFIDALNFDDQGEYFGLQPVKELEQFVKQEKQSPVAAEVPEKADEIRQTEIVNNYAEVPAEEISEERKKLSTATKVILVTASLILIGMITYFVLPGAFDSFRQKSNVPEHKIPVKKPVGASLPKTLTDSTSQADTIYQQLSKEGFEVEKPKDTLAITQSVTTSTQPVTPENTGESFEIIGAAFARRPDAEAYVKQLHSKGIYAKIVDMPGSKLKISLGTFNDEASAKKGLIRIQKELNKDAWIARVKPKKTNKK
jgi:cell division septation protein DedD